MTADETGRRYHFIGIGGIGMGMLASLLLDKGCEVSGSDLRENEMTRALAAKGAVISRGHDAAAIGDADVVVCSSAIPRDNPERTAALREGRLLLSRAQLLARLMEAHVGIGVAGAHGKTTTASMISWLLVTAGLQPTTAVGGILAEGCHARLGAGRYFVAELDESDGSFLLFHPHYTVVTNIDLEHIDYYRNWENIVAAYRAFLDRCEPGGWIVACGDDDRLRPLLDGVRCPVLTYGFREGVDLRAVEVTRRPSSGCRFRCLYQGEPLGEVTLMIPGAHNVLNALACLGVGLRCSLDFATIVRSLECFPGVRRRFQVKGEAGGVLVVDDYGHHPTEMAAVLRTAREWDPARRLVTVFQPHRYTRTAALMDAFVEVLASSDRVIVTDIYPAAESPIPGVTGRALGSRLAAAGHRDAAYVPQNEIVGRLSREVRPGDLVLTLGAGDVYRAGEVLLDRLRARSAGPVGGGV